MKTRALTLVALLLATALAGCVSQRFAAPVRQPQAAPQASSGPYTREREDREFGQPAK
jgi:outer membrane PBP1 activator LpoA protein